MIKVLFICHGRTNDYCSMFDLLEQNGASKGFCCAKALRLDYD